MARVKYVVSKNCWLLGDTISSEAQLSNEDESDLSYGVKFHSRCKTLLLPCMFWLHTIYSEIKLQALLSSFATSLPSLSELKISKRLLKRVETHFLYIFPSCVISLISPTSVLLSPLLVYLSPVIAFVFIGLSVFLLCFHALCFHWCFYMLPCCSFPALVICVPGPFTPYLTVGFVPFFPFFVVFGLCSFFFTALC